MEKINIAELLKDCPDSMELDCTLFEKPVKYIGVTKYGTYVITMKTSLGNVFYLTKDGRLHDMDDAKCIIYPKGKTTWEGFVPPCNFKDGDVIYVRTRWAKWVSIFKEDTGGGIATYADYCLSNRRFYGINDDSRVLCQNNRIYEKRFATEEEKQKLFDAIKDNGYRWDAENKTFEELIKPKFKVGDKVRHKNNHNVVFTVTSIEEDSYGCGIATAFWFDNQDDYELVPNKFDITTLKPFDKVLVRNKSNEVWTANFYSHYDATSDKPFICVGWSEMNEYRYCIPYEVNNELLGTTNNTEEYGSR